MFSQNVLDATNGSITNFEGVAVPLSDEFLRKLDQRSDKHPFLEHFIETIMSPREVWAMPGDNLNMHYMRVFGNYDISISVLVDENGVKEVLTMMGTNVKKNNLEEDRRGVLVYLRQ